MFNVNKCFLFFFLFFFLTRQLKQLFWEQSSQRHECRFLRFPPGVQTKTYCKEEPEVFISLAQTVTCQCCFLCPVLLCERMCVSVCVCFNISDNYPKPSAFLCIFKPQCCSSHLAEPPLFIHVNPVFNGVTSKVLV